MPAIDSSARPNLSMLRKAYLSGALSALLDPRETKAFYERVAAACEGEGVDLYLPHQVSDPLLRPDLTPREVYDLDRSQIERSELVIAYVGVASLGVGCEVEIAHALGIPVLLLYESDARISRMLRGNPAVVAEIAFDSYEEAPGQIADWLRLWQRG